MKHFLINGSSSLLFIISSIKACYCSELILWKIFNGLLVGVSFLNNASEFNKKYLLLDYLTIFLISTSYINNFIINNILLLLLYKYSLEYIKNISVALACIKCLINTYFYASRINLYLILVSSAFGAIIYKIRYTLAIKKNIKYNLLLTYLFHICITIILYNSSITAK
jgi:hypothetical protein